jgi:hypothetical protein
VSLVSTLSAVSQMEGESGLMTKKGFGAERRYRTVSPIHAVCAVPPQTIDQTDILAARILRDSQLSLHKRSSTKDLLSHKRLPARGFSASFGFFSGPVLSTDLQNEDL